ncbi:MAG: hypothetical protein NTW86_06320 [Candidatus Sumerlaeota bacterium]|nr:hypothetical protein [Candidatus Sumerlaeota bacterium]
MRTGLRWIPPLCALLVAPAAADWLVMADGRREQCVIDSEDSASVRIARGGGLLTVARSNIASIARESPADNLALRAEYLFGGEPLLTTIQRYAAARDRGASAAALSASLARVMAKLPPDPASTPSEARDALTALLRSLAGAGVESAPEDFYYYASSWLSRGGAMNDAARLFQKLPSGYFDRHPERRAALSDAVVADIRLLLDQGDFAAVLDRLEALHALDPARSRSCEAIMRLSQAHELKEQGKFADAARIYLEEVKPEFPAIARDRARAVLQEAAAKARENGSFPAAIDLMKSDGPQVFDDKEREQMLGDLYRDWGLWQLDHNQFDGARQALREYYARHPEKEALLTKVIEYRERKAAATAPEDHYKLAKFCLGAELYDEAAAEFRLAAAEPKLRDLAEANLHRLENDRYQRMLLEALDLNKEGQFAAALEKQQFVAQHAHDDDVQADAKRVADLIKEAMDEAKARAPKEAEVLMQNAERCVLPDEADTCLELLTRIVREYPNTPAAERAAAFRSLLLSRGLRRLEGGARRDERGSLGSIAANEPRKGAAEDLSSFDALREETRRMEQALETPAERVPSASKP